MECEVAGRMTAALFLVIPQNHPNRQVAVSIEAKIHAKVALSIYFRFDHVYAARNVLTTDHPHRFGMHPSALVQINELGRPEPISTFCGNSLVGVPGIALYVRPHARL